MKALFPKQTNFAVSNFLTKAERLQERYLKYWLNLLLCNSIASIAVLEQTKPAIFCLQNFCETFWNPKQLFCFSTTTKPHLLRVLHVVTHVKFSFCATILFKVWEGWVSSNNFYEDSKVPTLFIPTLFLSSILQRFTLCLVLEKPNWLISPPADNPETLPQSMIEKRSASLRVNTCQLCCCIHSCFVVFGDSHSFHVRRRNPTNSAAIYIYV